ncbi:T9SS type A sorting domain-containing protein [Flavobacterium sp.]|jgi:hypothetical protein|uniref:T9SS type A sorting domain-containing protein n=1 Tax=Flavobacterium sp. TaxID=239 RepID=UPI0037BE845D
MKHNKEHIIIILLIILSSFRIMAQQAINASGANATGSGGSVSYSVGQVLYTTNSGSNGSSAQGVQQPYEISTTLSLPEANDIRLMSVYPNPTTNRVVLNVGNYGTTNLSLQFIDSNGRILLENKIINIETNLDIENYPVAIYFLKVMDKNSAIKIFKIIKN